MFLLVISGAAFGSLVGSLFCTDDMQVAYSFTAGVGTYQAQPESDAGEPCPLATLAEIVSAPMVVSLLQGMGSMRAAYVAPLYLSPHYRVDPEPPTKPPSA